MNKDKVIEMIESAFEGVPRPLEITLHVAEAHDNYDYGQDAIHRQKDHQGPWQEIPDEHIEECQWALSHVDPVGFRYYLPAFMTWYLRNYTNAAKVMQDHALYALDPCVNDPELRLHKDQRVSLFSKEQLASCAVFVRFLAEDSTGMTDETFADRIYMDFWHQYDES